ncbi:uncharacterized protein WCC33_009333 [Rhinophrynus dorsalis]
MAHSTSSVRATWAYKNQALAEQLHKAATWSCLHTFTKQYRVNVLASTEASFGQKEKNLFFFFFLAAVTTQSTSLTSTVSTNTPIETVTTETTRAITKKPVTGKDETSSSTTRPPQPEPCHVTPFNSTITKDHCSAEVPLTKCSGVCSSEAWYNDDFTSVEGYCTCCMPVKSSIIVKRLDLLCPNGSYTKIYIKVIQECECHYEPCRYHSTTVHGN